MILITLGKIFGVNKMEELEIKLKEKGKGLYQEHGQGCGRASVPPD